MAERSYNDRVDDTILSGSLRLAEFRKATVRQVIAGHREQCYINWQDSVGTDMEDYWRHRIDRCNVLLQEPDDSTLKRRALVAVNREG